MGYGYCRTALCWCVSSALAKGTRGDMKKKKKEMTLQMHPVAISNTTPPSSDDITGTHTHGLSPSSVLACQPAKWTFVQVITPRKVVPLLLLALASSEVADPRPQGVARLSQAFPSRLYTYR